MTLVFDNSGRVGSFVDHHPNRSTPEAWRTAAERGYIDQQDFLVGWRLWRTTYTAQGIRWCNLNKDASLGGNPVIAAGPAQCQRDADLGGHIGARRILSALPMHAAGAGAPVRECTCGFCAVPVLGDLQRLYSPAWMEVAGPVLAQEIPLVVRVCCFGKCAPGMTYDPPGTIRFEYVIAESAITPAEVPAGYLADLRQQITVIGQGDLYTLTSEQEPRD
jgi:hypothetical protein